MADYGGWACAVFHQGADLGEEGAQGVQVRGRALHWGVRGRGGGLYVVLSGVAEKGRGLPWRRVWGLVKRFDWFGCPGDVDL